MRSMLLMAIAMIAAPPAAGQTPAASGAPPAAARPRGTYGFLEPLPRDWNDHTGFVSLFDGVTLQGWDGDPAVWRVEGGAIVGERAAKPPRNNDYLVYRAAKARNFDLRLEIRALTGGTGIQYRSRTGLPWTNGFVHGAPAPNLNWMMTGPQADLWAAKPAAGTVFNGQVYIENSPERIVAWRGQVTRNQADRTPRLAGTIGDRAALGQTVLADGWNQYEVIARGGVVLHIINGQLMAAHIDDDSRSPDNQAGLIGIEAEGSPARIEVRNVWLRKLD